MSEHTPTPWNCGDQYLYADGRTLPVASGQQDWATNPGGPNYKTACANAAFIVKAVNNHEALVKALEFIRDGYDNQDVNHVDFRVKAYQVACDVLNTLLISPANT
jgi:hypothetical protein